MQLQEVFDQLSSGEFSQLSIGGQGAGVISETNYGAVLNHINLGLVALYRRFNLKQNQLILQMQEDIKLYQLNSAFALHSRRSHAPVRYILDSDEARFEDDILKVERVLDEDGEPLSLNDDSDPFSVTTPSTLSLRVPDGLDNQDLTVIYRAKHPKLIVEPTYFNPAFIELELPESHLDALLYYVASRVNNPIGMTNEFHAGNSYMAKFEAACAELEGKGLQVDQGQTNDRLHRNGWI